MAKVGDSLADISNIAECILRRGKDVVSFEIVEKCFLLTIFRKSFLKREVKAGMKGEGVFCEFECREIDRQLPEQV